MKKCLFDWSFVLLSTAIRGLLSLKLWGDIVGKTFCLSWVANDLSKKQGCFKTFAFFFAVNIVLFSLFLGVLEKVSLTG